MSTNSTAVSVTSNVNVGMDEVVSVFVSQYETNLFNEKDRLSDKIKQIKQALKSLDESLVRSVDQSHYESTNEVLGISSIVEDVTVSWSKERNAVPSIVVQVQISNDDHDGGYTARGFGKNFRVEIVTENVAEYEKLTGEKDDLSSELANIMGLIKSVSRKERQIRGQISAKKLKEAGAESLLNDESILALVQL